MAVQISASPERELARATSFQVSPAPETVADCLPAPAGPSELTNANSCSPPSAVVKGWVVVVP